MAERLPYGSVVMFLLQVEINLMKLCKYVKISMAAYCCWDKIAP